MQIIVDIDENLYIKTQSDKYVIYDKMYHAIKNGIPLDNIISQIEQPSEDCISRQAVLDALDKSKYSNEFCEAHHIDWSINLGMAHIVVNELKPVTPRTNLAEASQDCISRAEVRKILGNEVFELTKLHTVNPEDNPKADAMAYGVNWSLNTLMELPSVTPERPKGKWIHWTDDYKDYCTCSECGYGEEGEVLLKDKTPYCPYCGAEMEEDAE